MKFIIAIFIFCTFGVVTSFAQRQPENLTYQVNTSFSSSSFFKPDFPEGSVSPQEINMQSYAGDTSAVALVLNENGKAFFISNTANPPIQFEYHVRIKILKDKGLSYGEIEIPLYNRDKGSYERLREVKAATFYKDESGAVKKATLTDDMIKTIKLDEHNTVVRFTMPALKKGCVIDYKYITETPYINNFKTWKFQWLIPKVQSVFNVSIPQIFGYEVAMKGTLKLDSNAVQQEKKCYYYNNNVSDCLDAVYIMKNIPALHVEPFMPGLKNYASALYFQLTDMTAIPNFADRNYGVHLNIGKDWNELEKYLKTHDELGEQLKKKDVLKNEMAKVLQGKTDAEDKAKTIYKFIQNAIKWNGVRSIFSPAGIKKAYERHTGNSADINLALISALSTAGIKAEAVVMSSHENGLITRDIPSLNDFDYLIARVTINNKQYFADATDISLAFSQLPERAINVNKVWLINMAGSNVWIDAPTTDNGNDDIDISLLLQPDGRLKGTITITATGYAAYVHRHSIKQFATQHEYLNMLEKSRMVTITNADITNSDNVELPFKATYQIEAKLPDDNKIDLGQIIPKETPPDFKQQSRVYPIDMTNTPQTSYKIVFDTGDNYVIKKAPQDVSETLPGEGGKLSTVVKNEGNKFVLQQSILINKNLFSPKEYQDIKHFFDKALTSGNLTVIIGKKI
ncbi:DUF3857 domain-containing protein [Mucilaginibacter limnophilus]|uniref:DUF3857 domain-containing protein n=1 Tax=Mucilaginibacter limnophilus TaxID=1932778 RepID=A0A437MZL6_9SPHI|nr:DUF3857 domain-containing protein [Mucilaginibacter limnophilus]RVU03102.1 DUF3857 domain-containing protein [Mucilaginibacter limnophilus]